MPAPGHTVALKYRISRTKGVLKRVRRLYALPSFRETYFTQQNSYNVEMSHRNLVENYGKEEIITGKSK